MEINLYVKTVKAWYFLFQKRKAVHTIENMCVYYWLMTVGIVAVSSKFYLIETIPHRSGRKKKIFFQIFSTKNARS